MTSAKKVMIDDDDIGGERFLARVHHKAPVEVRAFAAEAVFARGGDVSPDGGRLRHVGEFAPISRRRRARERLDAFQVTHVGARRQGAARNRSLEMMMANVVAAPLEQGNGDRDLQRVTHHWQVTLEKLILQCFRAGRDDDLAARKQRWNEIRQRLAGASAGFGDQLALRLNGVGDRFRHRQLLRARAIGGKFVCERSVRAENPREFDGVQRLSLLRPWPAEVAKLTATASRASSSALPWVLPRRQGEEGGRR